VRQTEVTIETLFMLQRTLHFEFAGVGSREKCGQLVLGYFGAHVCKGRVLFKLIFVDENEQNGRLIESF
jgi:hypothetical protein